MRREQDIANRERTRLLDDQSRQRSIAVNNRQIEELQRTQQARDRQRQDQLRRAMASQRARAGASGLSSAGGSVQAILNGLIADSDRVGADVAGQTQRSIADLRTASQRINEDTDSAFRFQDEANARADRFRREQEDLLRANQSRSRSLLSDKVGAARDIVGTYNNIVGFGRSLIT